MAQEYLATPKEAPDLNIPQSEEHVKVSIIDTTSYVCLPIEPYLKPVYKGKTHLTGPAFSFLIEHESGKKVLFDMGIRKDVENFPPTLLNSIKTKNWTVKADKNVADILQDSGVDVAGGAIDAVIWSHHHWDHVGDLSGTFPPSTQLVVGPGFTKAHLPGYPANQASQLQQADFEGGRDVRELDIAAEGRGLRIGRFAAYDYFGDGTFYILDTPGHSVGHVCGLARTTTAAMAGTSHGAGHEPTFVFMGGDASHHGGEFRPSEYLPLPASLSPSPIARLAPACPGHLLRDVHRDGSATEPFYLVRESFAHDLELCEWTIAGLQEFDAADGVLLVVAHDESVLPVLDFYPQSMNGWHAKGLAKKAKWKFLADFEGAVAEGERR
ncbi:hypothetical protein MBLNU459_g0587t1 [Dothideomycetes sp. NU459]